MIDNFNKAKKILGKGIPIVAVNGCCYGCDDNPDKGAYFKYCGQRFWQFISDDENLYIEIIEPLGFKAQEKNEEFLKEYAQIINKFTLEFGHKFCGSNGAISWDRIVQLNSGKKKKANYEKRMDE